MPPAPLQGLGPRPESSWGSAHPPAQAGLKCVGCPAPVPAETGHRMASQGTKLLGRGLCSSLVPAVLAPDTLLTGLGLP